jgi:integrase
MNLNKILRTNRPELSESSIKTYSSILFNLYTSVFGITPLKMENFNNTTQIQNYLEEAKEPNVRKTILSALYVLTKNPKYRDQMLDNIKAYNIEIDKQEKTPTQKESWLKTEEIKQSIISAKSRAINAYRNIKQLHTEHGDKDIGRVFSKQFQIIQDYIILCLLSGSFIPPRRSKDYVDFKIKNIDTTTDNYIKGSKMYFNSYKGSGAKGLQVIEIPIALKNILTKWIKNNPTDYLIFDSEYNQMSNVKLTQRLNKIFSRKSSVNSLRHTYLTDKHKDTSDKMDELATDMKMMGSSILQRKTYIKTD